jgi:hypothetical protein
LRAYFGHLGVEVFRDADATVTGFAGDLPLRPVTRSER